MADLASAFAKISRAEEHARELADRIKRFDRSHPYTTRCDPNLDGSQHALVLVLDESREPARWSCIIGDALHNLRCALDHTLYAAILAERDDPGDTQYPIFTSESEFNRTNRDGTPGARSGLRKIQQVTNPAVRDAIVNSQPYRRMPEVGSRHRSALVVLEDLDNADKHGALHPVFLLADQADRAEPIVTVNPEQDGVVWEFSDAVENEAAFLRIFTRPDSEVVNVNFKVTFYVSLRFAGGIGGPLALLQSITQEVRKTVVSVGAAITPRGGAT